MWASVMCVDSTVYGVEVRQEQQSVDLRCQDIFMNFLSWVDGHATGTDSQRPGSFSGIQLLKMYTPSSSFQLRATASASYSPCLSAKALWDGNYNCK